MAASVPYSRLQGSGLRLQIGATLFLDPGRIVRKLSGQPGQVQFKYRELQCRSVSLSPERFVQDNASAPFLARSGPRGQRVRTVEKPCTDTTVRIEQRHDLTMETEPVSPLCGGLWAVCIHLVR